MSRWSRGPGFILDKLCGLSFRISSQSFYQVNSVQTEVLYRQAIELAGFTGAEHAIDAYCGTGTIGLVAASMGAAQVTGVDCVESSIRDARQNARHNGVDNARFAVADAGAFMRDMAAQAAAAGVQAPTRRVARSCCSWTRRAPAPPRSFCAQRCSWRPSASSISRAIRKRGP